MTGSSECGVQKTNRRTTGTTQGTCRPSRCLAKRPSESHAVKHGLKDGPTVTENQRQRAPSHYLKPLSLAVTVARLRTFSLDHLIPMTMRPNSPDSITGVRIYNPVISASPAEPTNKSFLAVSQRTRHTHTRHRVPVRTLQRGSELCRSRWSVQC
jgi:hypothetical protein